MTAEQRAVLTALRHHASDRYPIKIDQLVQLLGFKRRVVEDSIEALRGEGVPICSGRRGCWFSEDPDEVMACYRSLRGRFLTQARNASAMKRTALRLQAERARIQQTELWAA